MKNFETLNILETIEQKSTCVKRKVAALLLEDGEIVKYGVNQVALPFKPTYCVGCSKGGKLTYENGLPGVNIPCPAIHAEVDCLSNYTLNLDKDYAMVISYSPCPECCKLLSHIKGIKRVYVATPRYKPVTMSEQLAYLTNGKMSPDKDNYDTLAKRLLNAAGILYIRMWEKPSTAEVF